MPQGALPRKFCLFRFLKRYHGVVIKNSHEINSVSMPINWGMIIQMEYGYGISWRNQWFYNKQLSHIQNIRRSILVLHLQISNREG